MMITFVGIQIRKLKSWTREKKTQGENTKVQESESATGESNNKYLPLGEFIGVYL
jgi:hypothetical protein